MTRYGMAIDIERCSGCQTCVVACQLFNAQQPGTAWIHVEELEQGRWPHADRAYFPHACMHCDEPLCVKVCPTAASFQREDSTVGIAYEKCIGCGVCQVACVYDARTINTGMTWYYDASSPAPYEEDNDDRKGVAEKCTFCYERVVNGQEPVCVESCINGIRVFGDLDDAQSAIHAYIDITGAKNIPGTSLYYAIGKHEIDPEEIVTKSSNKEVSEDAEAKNSTALEANPVVLAASGLAAVATTAGLLEVKKRQKKQEKSNKVHQGEGDI